MFDIGAPEMLLIVIVAILVIGPKELPQALRMAGRWVGKARATMRQVRGGFDAMVREAEMEDMEKKWAAHNERIMRETGSEGANVGDGEMRELLVDDGSAAAPSPPATAAAAPESCGSRKTGRIVSDIDDSTAPLLDHLIELRSRLVWCVVALAIAFGVCFAFAERIFGYLVWPLTRAFDGQQGRLIYTQLYEAFFVEIKVALFAAFCIAFPFISNQLWAFVAPGLYAKEKRAFLPFLLATPVLFAAGGSLAYFVVMPLAFEFFLGFEGSVGGLEREALPSVGPYLDLVMQFILAFGVCFELPVLLLLLNRAGLVTRAQLAGLRRYIIVGSFALAAILTPPDVISQLLLGLPMILLYEVSMLIMRFTERKVPEASVKVPEASVDEAEDQDAVRTGEA